MSLDYHSLWSLTEPNLFEALGSAPTGLSTDTAEKKLAKVGLNQIEAESQHPRIKLLVSQFKSPIAILLGVAAILSTTVGDAADGLAIIAILGVSALLGFWQELRAYTAIQALLKRLAMTSSVLRDSAWVEIESSRIVPGDIVRLSAGSAVPADCRLITSKDLSVDQSSLTGESFPCDRSPGLCAASAPLDARSNVVFVGSHVVSGEATALAVFTGRSTTYGSMARTVLAGKPPTEFEVGVRRFGYFLLEVAVVLSLIVLAVNLTYERPALDALLFTLALVVGMTPQLLPAIVTTTLAQGAHRMAQQHTIVRRLTGIADLGGIEILCIDKTGTLTEGTVEWEGSLAYDGTPSEKVALFASLNATYQTGFANPIDEALRSHQHSDLGGYVKLDELPYDFNRRMLSVLVQSGAERLMVTKGAVQEVLNACSEALLPSGGAIALNQVRDLCEQLFHEQSRQGKRCLAVAYKILSEQEALSRESEREMILAGLVVFADPPKPTAASSVQALEAHGVTCKLVTGDNRFVAAKLAADLGVFEPDSLMTGAELDALSARALVSAARDIYIFSEVDPNQKERIIRALKKSGMGVGYLGDGINDAAALHAADVGISVDTATAITKEAADIVLLAKDLGILLTAVKEGRKAFSNTLKYILVTTSANFGNMFSVAGASLFADFLPMLPKQILLLNVLSDLPAMALAADRVDEDMLTRPMRWNTDAIRTFMIVYGLVSSVFDYLTFGTLLMLGSPAPLFRTAWFIESVLSEVFMLLVLRTRQRFWRSQPGHMLVVATAVVIAVTALLPYSSLAGLFGFVALNGASLAVIIAILVGYVWASEAAKRTFIARSLKPTKNLTLAVR